MLTYQNSCDSGINNETDKETSTHPQTILIGDVAERSEPATTMQKSLKKKCKKQKKEERVRRVSCPSSDRSEPEFTDSISLKSSVTVLFEPMGVEGDNVKTPDLEKGAQSGINILSIMADNPNTACSSARVESTMDLTFGKQRNVASFPTRQKEMSTRDKIDRIEGLLMSLKDKAKGIALKTHFKRKNKNKASLKKEDDQTPESRDIVEVRPGRLIPGKTMVPGLKEGI